MDETPTPSPVITLSAEQSQLLATAGSAVEIRDSTGRTIGFLLYCPEITRFYTPNELGELQRLAALRAPGRSLSEIMEAIRREGRSVKRFTVAWHDDVADQLAALVVKHWGAPLGQQISDAANLVDRELSTHPQAVGHCLVANVQLVVVGPLAVEYAIFAEDRQVTLLGYHLCSPRSS